MGEGERRDSTKPLLSLLCEPTDEWASAAGAADQSELQIQLAAHLERSWRSFESFALHAGHRLLFFALLVSLSLSLLAAGALISQAPSKDLIQLNTIHPPPPNGQTDRQTHTLACIRTTKVC